MAAPTATAIVQQVDINEAHVEQDNDGRFKTIWMGWWFGGTFRHQLDAYLLRDWCLGRSIDEALAWLGQHEGEVN